MTDNQLLKLSDIKLARTFICLFLPMFEKNTGVFVSF